MKDSTLLLTLFVSLLVACARDQISIVPSTVEFKLDPESAEIIHSIAGKSEGEGIYLVTNRDVYKRKGEAWTAERQIRIRGASVAVKDSTEAWVGGFGEMFRFLDGNWQYFSRPGAMLAKVYSDVTVCDKEVWAASLESELLRHSEIGFERIIDPMFNKRQVRVLDLRRFGGHKV